MLNEIQYAKEILFKHIYCKQKMYPAQSSKSFRHFVKNLFLVGSVYLERKKAKEDVGAQLQRMKKSIISMNLSYSDIDKLKEKIDKLINWERRYAKLFKPEDSETLELKNQMNHLEQELRKEREAKINAVNDNNSKIKQLTESLISIKNQMRHLLMERAKRHHKLKALEHKIKRKVNVHGYYTS